MKKILTLLCFVVLFACTGHPDNIKPVKGFDLGKYLGTWYEVARLDHSFERGMQQVTATYSMRDDGGVRVINRGFDTHKKRWENAEGKAYFVDDVKENLETAKHFGISTIWLTNEASNHAYIDKKISKLSDLIKN